MITFLAISWAYYQRTEELNCALIMEEAPKHFAIAEILPASGMRETIDEQVRDVEEIGCLRANGRTNTAGLLAGTNWGWLRGLRSKTRRFT